MSTSKSRSQREKAVLVAVWVPKKMKETLDQAVIAFDSDRSKYIRNALREKLSRELNNAA
jgi:metal-responsive CopG/Arc/MetJ family transcriptional regulator